MSTFCTSCGAANSGAGFCTSCGTPATASVTSPAVAPTPAITPITETAWSNLEESVDSAEPSVSSENGQDVSKKKILVNAAVFVLIVGIGVGAFFAGKSSVDLQAERKAGYDSGFSAGDSAGYDRGDSDGYDRGDSAGYSRGYSTGFTAGCESVFNNASYADHLIEYYPTNYYYRYGSTYVSKTGC